ncbi:hypothetical protein C048_02296 [Brucella melitensis UK19/04]|nr:putative zinc-finger protein [Brucella melitensis bv. 1 str. 16M]ENQ68255.1 hypothetical protein C962_02289 [Brucella melitensis CNGB 1076]ENQ71287.1 hypothetical protein C963_02292 [Brucella melitensis CNGB 1120]ENQ75269.1 hypothetical protein C964_02289 [Brucella melitensis CNGB 290]ENQ78036.1 hypothetical protein C057_02759 [Brucella melitensis F10/05-2]ENQ84293.1 hypothetical protein C056_02729 [Brucella melitensis F3/02]ENQ94832.1 hypothetical protein C048_02296 [Brucella melitensis U
MSTLEANSEQNIQVFGGKTRKPSCPSARWGKPCGVASAADARIAMKANCSVPS